MRCSQTGQRSEKNAYMYEEKKMIQLTAFVFRTRDLDKPLKGNRRKWGITIKQIDVKSNENARRPPKYV